MAGHRSPSPHSNRSWRAHGAVSLGSRVYVWLGANRVWRQSSCYHGRWGSFPGNCGSLSSLAMALWCVCCARVAWAAWLFEALATVHTGCTAQRVGTLRRYDSSSRTVAEALYSTFVQIRHATQPADLSRSGWSSFHCGFALVFRPQARWRLCPLGRGHVAGADAAVWCVYPYSFGGHGNTLSVWGPRCRWELHSTVAACNTRAIRGILKRTVWNLVRSSESSLGWGTRPKGSEAASNGAPTLGSCMPILPGVRANAGWQSTHAELATPRHGSCLLWRFLLNGAPGHPPRSIFCLSVEDSSPP